MKYTLLLLLSLLSLPTNAFAHFIWLDGNCEAASECEVKLYFGEYPRVVEKSGTGRLTERQGARLNVHGFDGQTSTLKLTDQGTHYRAAFPRINSSSFQITAIDDSSAVVDYTKHRIGIVRPIFYAKALIATTGGQPQTTNAPTLDIAPETPADMSVGKPTTFSISFQGTPLKQRAEIRVNAPNGWVWEGDADDKGRVSFVPLWPGLYVADVIVLEGTPGEFQGKAYEAVRHRATLALKAK